MIRIRPVHGTLEEAMRQVTQHETFDEIVNYLSDKLRSYGLLNVDKDKFTIEPYGYDARIDWHTGIILYDGMPQAYLQRRYSCDF